MEKWRTIEAAPNYSVSNKGRVRRDAPGPRTRPGLVLRPGRAKHGYLHYVLRHEGRAKTHKAHQLVMECFGQPRPSETHTIDHINRDKADNCIENLRWATPAEQRANTDHTPVFGERVTSSRVTEAQVIEIREWYGQRTGKYHDTDNSLSAIARHYGIGMQTVHAIVTGRTWKHLLPGEDVTRLRK